MQKAARYLKILLNRSGLFGRVVSQFIVDFRFRDEIKSLQGTLPDNLNGRSMVHFSMNKSASQFIGKVLKSYAARCQMDFLSYNGLAFNSLVPVMEQIRMSDEKSRSLFKATGQVHSFFGRPVPDLNSRSDLTILFVIRDPRDICVSHLESLRKTHSEPLKTSSETSSFLQRRKILNALNEENAYNEIFEEIKNHPNEMLSFYKSFSGTKILVKYEELLNSPKLLYDKLDKHFDIKTSISEMDRIGYVHAKKFEKNNSHHRSGRQGQYLFNLQPELVRQMNEEWNDFLKEFGYTAP